MLIARRKNIRFFKLKNFNVLDMPAREAVRTMDAMESEHGYFCEKSIENYDFIGTEARNVFTNGLSAAALKCSSGLNMHGKGEHQTNESMEDNSCPRFNELEHWNHVIQRGFVKRKGNECLGRLRKKLEKNRQ